MDGSFFIVIYQKKKIIVFKLCNKSDIVIFTFKLFISGINTILIVYVAI